MKNKRVSIMVSMQTAKRLHAIKTQVEKILGKSISDDQLVRIILSTRSLDDALSELILER